MFWRSLQETSINIGDVTGGWGPKVNEATCNSCKSPRKFPSVFCKFPFVARHVNTWKLSDLVGEWIWEFQIQDIADILFINTICYERCGENNYFLFVFIQTLSFQSFLLLSARSDGSSSLKIWTLTNLVYCIE